MKVQDMLLRRKREQSLSLERLHISHSSAGGKAWMPSLSDAGVPQLIETKLRRTIGIVQNALETYKAGLASDSTALMLRSEYLALSAIKG